MDNNILPERQPMNGILHLEEATLDNPLMHIHRRRQKLAEVPRALLEAGGDDFRHLAWIMRSCPVK